MSFLKSLLIAVFMTLLLTYFFGISLLEWLNIDVDINDELFQNTIEPLKKISISALVVVALILIAAFIVFSVFGALIAIAFLSLGAIFIFLIGAFWPVVLIGIVIWYLGRAQRSPS